MSDTNTSLRVLVVDDSAYNRRTLASILDAIPGVEVVAKVGDGQQALVKVFELAPDLITLDLAMPGMDGFAFLRLVMAKRPTPVLIVSSFAQRDNVFRALELGAIDFVAKPGPDLSPDLQQVERDLVAKVEMVRRLRRVTVTSAPSRDVESAALPRVSIPSGQPRRPPRRLIAIVASTGGPPLLQGLLSRLPATLPVAVMVAQHMPGRFTGPFADRLDRTAPMDVVEARDGDALVAGTVYVAPGSSNLEVRARPHDGSGSELVVGVVPPDPEAVVVITPSGDHLFASVAAHFGSNLCVVVLTGMGVDGRRGAELARRHGAHVVVEDPEHAVMPGMPRAVLEAGLADEVLAGDDLAPALERFASSRPC